MKILLTAFEPFGGEAVNPAQEAVALVPEEVAGTQIVKITVPVVFSRAIETVCDAIDREMPDAVLCIGQAGGRTEHHIAIAGNIGSGKSQALHTIIMSIATCMTL